jgi:O-antigen/teichoic acid export membrane protein
LLELRHSPLHRSGVDLHTDQGHALTLKKNILANYAGQMYVAVVGVVMVPFYLRYLGVEAYGLVGFFAMMQVWFQVLDIGLTQTMSREAARFKGGAVDALSLRRLLRSLEGVFIAVGIAGAVGIGLGSSSIAAGWLKVQHIDVGEVRQAVVLMGILVALRWICGLYRGVINGFEKLLWLNAFNIIVATARFMLVIPLLMYVGATPLIFFEFQVGVAVVELLFLVGQTYRLLPAFSGARVTWAWAPLRPVLKFSLAVAFTSSAWVLLTQVDKLILSKLLPLADYGVYTLAVVIAGVVTLISGPISAALQPRMTNISVSGSQSELIALYRHGTQLVGIISMPAALLLIIFPVQALSVWTGNPSIAAGAAPLLRLYALGNGILAFAAFPYYLQFARGELRLHILGNVLFLLTLLPTMVWAASTYGAKGAGYAWALSSLGYFLFWIPFIHKHFLPGKHIAWLLHDVAPTVVPPTILAIALNYLVSWPENRLAAFMTMAAIGMALVAVSVAATGIGRKVLGGWWQERMSMPGNQGSET